VAAGLVAAAALADVAPVPLVPAEFVGGELAVAAVTVLLVVAVSPAVVVVVEQFDTAPPAVPFVAAVVVVVVAAAAVVAAVVAAAVGALAFEFVGFFLSSYQYCELTVAGVA